MEHYFFRTFSVNDNSPAGCNDQNDSFLREKHMYRDHPDEIILAIRTSNSIRGRFAYPDIVKNLPGHGSNSFGREQKFKNRDLRTENKLNNLEIWPSC